MQAKDFVNKALLWRIAYEIRMFTKKINLLKFITIFV